MNLYVKTPSSTSSCEVREATFADLNQYISTADKIELAKGAFEGLINEKGDALTSPELTIQYAKTWLVDKEREHFAIIFLDTQHKIIKTEILFSGTIDSATVHPREIAKRALELNSKSLICLHNHPSGYAEPSQCDRRITRRIIDAMSILDIKVLDHIVIGSKSDEFTSFAERGWI